MVSATTVSDMSKIQSSYAVKLELYTTTDDAPEELNLPDRNYEVFLNRAYYFMKEDECFFECTNQKIRSVLPNSNCNSLEPYFIFLREDPNKGIFWVLDSERDDVISIGHDLGFGRSEKHQDEGIWFHKLYECRMSEESPPSTYCGCIFEILLHKTPYLLDERDERLCGAMEGASAFQCHLKIPLRLLWALAAVQIRTSDWKEVLPGLIQHGILVKEDAIAPRDKVRVVALRISKSDAENDVVVPPLPSNIKLHGSGCSPF